MRLGARFRRIGHYVDHRRGYDDSRPTRGLHIARPAHCAMTEHGLPSNPFSELGEGPVLDHLRPFLLMEDLWGAAATLRHHLNTELPGRFFAGVFDDALVPGFSADDRQQIVATADSLRQGRFDLLGYQMTGRRRCRL